MIQGVVNDAYEAVVAISLQGPSTFSGGRRCPRSASQAPARPRLAKRQRGRERLFVALGSADLGPTARSPSSSAQPRA